MVTIEFFTRLDLGDRIVTIVILTRFDLGDRIVTYFNYTSEGMIHIGTCLTHL